MYHDHDYAELTAKSFLKGFSVILLVIAMSIGLFILTRLLVNVTSVVANDICVNNNMVSDKWTWGCVPKPESE